MKSDNPNIYQETKNDHGYFFSSRGAWLWLQEQRFSSHRSRLHRARLVCPMLFFYKNPSLVVNKAKEL